MNDTDHAYWNAYARSLADGLGLRDWTVVIERGKPESSTAAAGMQTVVGRRLVHIRLGDGFYNDTLENQRHYMLHELVHVFTDEIDAAIWQASDIIDSPAFQLLSKVVKDRIEFATDAIAAALGHAYPLPPERT